MIIALKKRKSGLEILGDIPWGTHFCLFYQIKEDLIDILVPYFKAGLENNEYCIWVTSEPLNEKDAESAMRNTLPNFEQYLKKKQIEIIPYTDWYLVDNEFESQRVLNGWIDKLNYAQDNGFDGLRLTGNTFWLEKEDWKSFTDYEEEVNNVIGNYQMIDICTYSLEKCGPLEIIKVICNHQFVLIRREGKWDYFKNMEQIKAEQKLKESEEILEKFMDSATDGFLLFDSNLNFIEANRISLHALGMKKEELIGKNILEIKPNYKESRIHEKFKQVLKTGKHFLVDDHFNHSKLGMIDISISSFKVGDGLGMIYTNITKRKRVVQELKELNKLKTELFERTSHELKTPLVSVKGYSDLLLKEYFNRLDDETISIIKNIKQGCYRLEKIIGDILKTSQFETGQDKLRISKEDLAFVIKSCLKDLKGFAKMRNHQILLNIHDQLIINFDKEKIYEVISNILSNSVKYTPPNGKIKIHSEIKEDLYVISIEDNGIGFTDKEKRQLFKKFGKIERYGHGWDIIVDGLGVGLYISKRIIELHGGKIWMESEGRNKGSTFYFSLPIVK